MTFPYYPGDYEVIRRAESARLDPPGTHDGPDMCAGCDLELEDCERGIKGGCVRCSICNEAGDCKYVDCGANEICSACPDGGHTKDGDCLYAEKAVAIAEDLRLEEGMDDARESRHE